MDIIPVFQLRKLKEVKHPAQKLKADGGVEAELGLRLGLEHLSGAFPMYFSLASGGITVPTC